MKVTISEATANSRPPDQKVYISDVRRAHEHLEWGPKVSTQEGVGRILGWIGSQPFARAE